jgi:hypothetical protein
MRRMVKVERRRWSGRWERREERDGGNKGPQKPLERANTFAST